MNYNLFVLLPLIMSVSVSADSDPNRGPMKGQPDFELGYPLLGDGVSSKEIGAGYQNCYVNSDFVDCEYRNKYGIDVLVFGQNVTRKCADIKSFDKKRNFPWEIKKSDSVSAVLEKSKALTGVDFIYDDTRKYAFSSHYFINRNKVTFSVELAFGDSGNIESICARDVDSGS